MALPAVQCARMTGALRQPGARCAELSAVAEPLSTTAAAGRAQPQQSVPAVKLKNSASQDEAAHAQWSALAGS